MLEVMVKADGRQKDYLFLATAAVPDSGTTLFLLSIALGFGLDDDHTKRTKNSAEWRL
jgi:hypothetical protein